MNKAASDMKTFLICPDPMSGRMRRCSAQYRALEHLGYDARMVAALRESYLDEGDVFVFYAPFDPQTHLFAEWARRKRKSVIVDIDVFPPALNARQEFDPITAMIAGYMSNMVRFASVVSAPTEFLAAQLRALNPNVLVVPDEIDERVWEWVGPTPRERLGVGEDEVIIGWAGAGVEAPAFDRIKAVLTRMVSKSPEVRLMLFEPVPEGLAIPEFRRLQLRADYLHQRVSALQLVDVAVVPTMDDLTGRCTGPYAVLESGMSGSAVVAGPSVAHSSLLAEGADLAIAEDDESWTDHLGALIANAELRRAKGQALRDFVNERHTVGVRPEAYAEPVVRAAAVRATARAGV